MTLADKFCRSLGNPADGASGRRCANPRDNQLVEVPPLCPYAIYDPSLNKKKIAGNRNDTNVTRSALRRGHVVPLYGLLDGRLADIGS